MLFIYLWIIPAFLLAVFELFLFDFSVKIAHHISILWAALILSEPDISTFM